MSATVTPSPGLTPARLLRPPGRPISPRPGPGASIVELMFNDLRARLSEGQMTLEMTPEARRYIAEQAAIPVLVDLWAPWCGPCRMVSPALAELATEMAGQIKLVKVNVDHSPQLQRRFGVQSIPTLLVPRNGHEIARQVGAAPAPQLRQWLTGVLGG